MPKIAIISASIRPDRNSHRVAMYFENFLIDNYAIKAEMLDLRQLNFPLFDEPLTRQKVKNLSALKFAKKVESAEGIIIVTPEYNGGIPASLKNAIDLLYEEWRHKPIGIVTVSSGRFGGSQALVALQFVLWKIKAWTITEIFSVANVADAYNELGVAKDQATTNKLAITFMKELLWCIKADTVKTLEL